MYEYCRPLVIAQWSLQYRVRRNQRAGHSTTVDTCASNFGRTFYSTEPYVWQIWAVEQGTLGVNSTVPFIPVITRFATLYDCTSVLLHIFSRILGFRPRRRAVCI